MRRCARANEISMIFQEPMTSLNPVMTIGKADLRGVDPAPRHGSQRRRSSAPWRCSTWLRHPRARANAPKEYPHQLVGRHAPARHDRHGAGLQSPRFLIARRTDDGARPSTIQAQILELIVELQREFSAAVILITHDLGVRRRDGAAGHRHVCRPQGSRRADVGRAVRPAAASLHGGPAGLDPAARPAARRGQERPPTACQEIPGMVPAAVRPCRTAAPFARRAAIGPDDLWPPASGRSTNRSGRLIGPPAGTAMVDATFHMLGGARDSSSARHLSRPAKIAPLEWRAPSA